MTFTTNLFRLLENAPYTTIDGYEIENMDWTVGDTRRRCEVDDSTDWVFHDQQVTVVDGQCIALAIDTDDEEETVEVSIVFEAKRWLIESDLGNT